MFTNNSNALNQIYNTACSKQISLLELVSELELIFNKKQEIIFGPERPGDVKHSLASIKKGSDLLGYFPKVSFNEGLRKTVSWYINEINSHNE